MRTILLPIRPLYVNEIINGNKKYEYRKKVVDIDKIVIYSTNPVKRVIGEVEVLEIISNSPNNLWEETKNYSGVTKELFMKYFEGKEKAYAYKLGKLIIYDKPKLLKEIGINYYPQSFVYLEK